MRAKLYKGPRHGKSTDIHPRDLEKGYVDFIVVDRNSNGRVSVNNYTIHNQTMQTVVYSGYKVARYEVRIMSGTIAGKSFSAPAMHPDGSIILQYKE